MFSERKNIAHLYSIGKYESNIGRLYFIPSAFSWELIHSVALTGFYPSVEDSVDILEDYVDRVRKKERKGKRDKEK